jgi:hypothetical protein
MHIQMSCQCIPLRMKEILSKDEVRKADLVRQLPYSDANDSHDLVEWIKEGTGTSIRNEDKIAYSKNFMHIYNGFKCRSHIA